MPTSAFIIPRRNDLDGVNMQVTDLRPNTSQRNLIYEGPGQSGYLKWSFDQPGATVVNGDSYVSGSMTTAPLLALVLADTTGGGNDVQVPNVTQFGLHAYLRERIEAGGIPPAVGPFPPIAPADAAAIAAALVAAVEAGTALDLATIDGIIAAQVANSELTGAQGSNSFGTVEDILRLLQGAAYRVRAATIITNAAGDFLPLGDAVTPATRVFLEANQVVPANPGNVTYYAQGGYLAADEPGARPLRELAVTGSMRISLMSGVMSGMVDPAFHFTNPNFDYAAGGVQTRATDIAGNPIPVTGVHPALAIYTSAGALL